jgi:hypothetical protein
MDAAVTNALDEASYPGSEAPYPESETFKTTAQFKDTEEGEIKE